MQSKTTPFFVGFASQLLFQHRFRQRRSHFTVPGALSPPRVRVDTIEQIAITCQRKWMQIKMAPQKRSQHLQESRHTPQKKLILKSCSCKHLSQMQSPDRKLSTRQHGAATDGWVKPISGYLHAACSKHRGSETIPNMPRFMGSQSSSLTTELRSNTSRRAGKG